ncbi:hypothetical protein ACLB2K_059881 [Fragaria x ananassa]
MSKPKSKNHHLYLQNPENHVKKPSEKQTQNPFVTNSPHLYTTRNQPVRPHQSPMETTYDTGSGTTEQTTPLVHGEAEGLRRTKMRVMVAIDESDSSFYALTWALDHLFINPPRTVEGGEGEAGLVTVVHVTQPFQHFVYPAGPGGATYYASASVVESVKKAQEESSAAILSRALQICKDRMIKAETLILTGDPKDVICQATEQMHVDLLVVGSRGLGMVKRAFLGSVSDYCAHHAACPVVIVKPPRGTGSKGSASKK